jgi:hypothetical protein
LEQNVEQTAPADSTSSVDAKLDRFFEPEPTQETQQTPQEQGGEQAEQQTQEAEAPPVETETAPALEEVDFEGAKYQLPPSIKAALMRQQDYTQKTQAVAERERMVALHQQRMQVEATFQQSVRQEQSQIAQLEAAIKSYETVNWPSLDVETYIKTKHQLDSLKEQKAEMQKVVDGKRQQFDGQMQEVNQRTLRQANEYIQKRIPKWGPEVQKELLSYGQTEGYSDVELGSIRDPRIIVTLHKARLWDALQSGKPLAAKRASGVPPVVKPGATKPVPSAASQYADTVKQLHQAKDPERKKALLDKSIDLKLDRMFK